MVSTIQIGSDGAMDIVQETQMQSSHQPLVNGYGYGVNGVGVGMDVPIAGTSGTQPHLAFDSHPLLAPAPVPTAAPSPEFHPRQPALYDMDLEKMHECLYKDRYLTPNEFLDDVRKIVHNAAMYSHVDPDRHYKAQAMVSFVLILGFLGLTIH